MEQKQQEQQGTSKQTDMQPNPGVQTVEIKHAPETAAPDTSVPAPDPAPTSVEDTIDATHMNPIEERAASQNGKYMIVIAVIAVVVIVLALLYMWGSRISQQDVVDATIETPQEQTDTSMGDSILFDDTMPAPAVPAMPMDTEIPVDTVLEDMPELDAMDADIEALEAELDAMLSEEGAVL
jgi:nitrogen fixation-related uncharacterized protein